MNIILKLQVGQHYLVARQSRTFFTSDNRGVIMFSLARPRSFVCQSVCKITQKRVHGFG